MQLLIYHSYEGGDWFRTVVLKAMVIALVVVTVMTVAMVMVIAAVGTPPDPPWAFGPFSQ